MFIYEHQEPQACKSEPTCCATYGPSAASIGLTISNATLHQISYSHVKEGATQQNVLPDMKDCMLRYIYIYELSNYESEIS